MPDGDVTASDAEARDFITRVLGTSSWASPRPAVCTECSAVLWRPSSVAPGLLIPRWACGHIDKLAFMQLAEAARAAAPRGTVGDGAAQRVIDSNFSWDPPWPEPFVLDPAQEAFEASAAAWRRSQPTQHSPYNVRAFEKVLAQHSDHLMRWVVLDTLCFGANVAYHGPRGPSPPQRPHKGALDNAAAIDKYLAEERDAGRLYMRLGAPPFANTRHSPLGVAPKTTDGVPSGWRITHDLSWGDEDSVNAYIAKLRCPTSTLRDYLTLVDSVSDPLIFKCDVQGAFRTIGIREVDQPLFGFVWRGHWCCERALNFGGRSSPARWGVVGAAIELALRQAGCLLVRYVDDFLFVAPKAEAAHHWATAQAVFADLGVPLAQKAAKLVPPCTRMTALGMIVDVVSRTVELPPYKLVRLRDTAASAARHAWIRAHELASFLGWLADAHVACPQLRLLENALWDGLGSARGHEELAISQDMREDFAALDAALASWSGVELSPVVRPTLLPQEYGVFTDASTDFGRGGYLVDHRQGTVEWFSQAWSALDRAWAQHVGRVGQEGKREATAWFELMAVLTAVWLWRGRFANTQLVLFSDCEPAVHIVNGGRARTAACAHLARALGRLLHSSHVTLTVVHVPTWSNRVADLLSHDQSTAALNLLGPSYRSLRRTPPSLAELAPACSRPPTSCSP